MQKPFVKKVCTAEAASSLLGLEGQLCSIEELDKQRLIFFHCFGILHDRKFSSCHHAG